MAAGKPAGVRCIQLTDDNLCQLFGRAGRPAVCLNLRPDEEMCGVCNEDAFERLAKWEQLTRP
jgi:hypothetical protein